MTADVPKTYTEPGTGKFAKGNPGGGRPALPSWLKDKGPDALKVLLAVATGHIEGEVTEHVQRAIAEASPELVHRAAADLADRIYGKAPQAVDVTSTSEISPAMRALLDLASTKATGPADVG